MSELQTYFKPEVKSLPFCPGCGHTTNLSHLDKAMKLINADPKRTVIVTDIGCVGLSDQYFDVHAFHGLHGRSITYATGIKLANPELNVIVLMGDGGCGIGGNHIVNAARRNVGITVMVFNNFNFGMTGGEHSVTTPFGGLTATTHSGNIEAPLDIIGLAQVCGAGYAARMTTFDKELPSIMAEAMTYQGFAILDIWEFCTAYYSPRNDMDKQSMIAMSETHNLPFGILTNRTDRTEYTVALKNQEAKTLKASPDLNQRFDQLLDQKIELVLSGGAGQKIKSTAAILGQAAILSGGYASQKDDYPITVKTGYSSAEVIISPENIDYTGMTAPNAALILSIEGFNKEKSKLVAMKAGSVIFLEEGLPEFETEATVIRKPFEAIAKKIDRNSVALVGLGALLAETRWLSRESVESAIGISQKAAYLEMSLKALKAGWELGNQA